MHPSLARIGTPSAVAINVVAMPHTRGTRSLQDSVVRLLWLSWALVGHVVASASHPGAITVGPTSRDHGNRIVVSEILLTSQSTSERTIITRVVVVPEVAKESIGWIVRVPVECRDRVKENHKEKANGDEEELHVGLLWRRSYLSGGFEGRRGSRERSSREVST